MVYLYPDDSPGRWAVSMADGNSWSVHFKHTSVLMATTRTLKMITEIDITQVIIIMILRGGEDIE